jgi:hypothetical protein
MTSPFFLGAIRSIKSEMAKATGVAKVKALPAQTIKTAKVTKHKRTMIIILSVVLGLTVIGAAISAYFLTRTVRSNAIKNIVNFADCEHEMTHVVKTKGGNSYWLGTLSTGLALFTSLEFDVTNVGKKIVPYTLTTMGMSNGSGMIASPMIGNVADFSLQVNTQVTAPPMLAEFDLATLLQNVYTITDFWRLAGTQPITAVNGQDVGQLAVITFTNPTSVGPAYTADACFLCTPGTDGFPLCVLGGLITVTTGVVPNTIRQYYNMGFMPLTKLIGGNTSPLIAFLNAYPQMPVLTKIDSPPTQAKFDMVPNFPNTYSTFGGEKIPSLTCLYDPLLQAGTEDGNVTGVGGCHEMQVAAFDLVPADQRAISNTRTFLDAIPQSATSDPKAFSDLNCNYAARVGTTGGLGIIRLRKWVDAPSPVTTYTIDNMIVQSNPDIETNASSNPYVKQLLRVPGQYTRNVNSATNATSLLYPLITDSDSTSYTPWKLGDFPTSGLCHDTNGTYQPDPARKTQTVASIPDEPIMAVLTRGNAFSEDGQTKALPFSFVIGWGMTTGTTYLRCGYSITAMAPPSVIQGDGTKTCAECTLPILQARTVCWKTGSHADLESIPAPEKSSVDSYKFIPSAKTAYPSEAPKTTPTDNPYVTLGSAVGMSSSLNGDHLGGVMAWTPLVTIPSGTPPERGYGQYRGSLAGSRVYSAVQGLCRTQYGV